MFGTQNKANWRANTHLRHTHITDCARDTFDDYARAGVASSAGGRHQIT